MADLLVKLPYNTRYITVSSLEEAAQMRFYEERPYGSFNYGDPIENQIFVTQERASFFLLTPEMETSIVAQTVQYRAKKAKEEKEESKAKAA